MMGERSRYRNTKTRLTATEGKRNQSAQRYQKNRADVARSLRELELLFGKRPPENGNAPRQRGAGDTGKLSREVLR